jgi:hypothetical protein
MTRWPDPNSETAVEISLFCLLVVPAVLFLVYYATQWLHARFCEKKPLPKAEKEVPLVDPNVQVCSVGLVGLGVFACVRARWVVLVCVAVSVCAEV